MAKLSYSLTSRVIGLVFLGSVVAGGCSADPAAQEQGQPPVAVELQQVETATVRETSEFVGALEAQERVALRPETQGRVVSVLVNSGEAVQPGQPIIELKADRSQAEVQGATADVDVARAAISAAEAELRTAQAERESAAADQTFAQSEYDRRRVLVEEGALPEIDLDSLTRQLEAANADLNASEQQVASAQDRLEQARAQLGRAQADQAAVTSDLEDSLVRAPIAGVMGDIPVKVGDYVTTSDTLTSIIQNTSLELNVSVPIERAPQLRVGLPVELLNEQGNPLTTGQISFVSPEVNATQQAVLAKASFPNQQGQLKDGQFVRARIVWQSGPGILVPTEAVTRIAGQTFVYVAQAAEPTPESEQPQQTVRQQPVTLGAIQGNSYQVISGIELGDEIVTAGVLNLSDGAPIMVGEPGQPPAQQ
ncbi:MAG: efflux RND transporter periplasmic adaptor subunit [Elainellaceae cyanobacterium]